MPLTHDQQVAVSQYLKTTASPPQCPVCGASNLRVQPDLVRFPSGDATDKHRSMVEVECQYCGYLLHFSPNVMGLSLDEQSNEDAL